MTATEFIEPTKAVGRLLVAGWRVERTFPAGDGTYVVGGGRVLGRWRKYRWFPHGELVEVVIEDTPADDVTGDVRQAVQ